MAGKQNSMLKTEEGRVRYYLYQREYRRKNIKYFRIRFNPNFDKDVISALEGMGDANLNEWLKNCVVEKLKAEGKI